MLIAIFPWDQYSRKPIVVMGETLDELNANIEWTFTVEFPDWDRNAHVNTATLLETEDDGSVHELTVYVRINESEDIWYPQISF
jgi:acyl-CoA thioesterase FadM